ncbi:hypothetical protein IMG5_101400 [Ichthyophthirius multifiliis]|uniref:GDA1/CD39 nucleoside phosphatase family protein n=1 Tax=Ichthyophthirius multifiliis TaxID=5932 RepID=G0QSI8_ICHMU|nr:hypothetical protein IMG5_101400 [Ichthyophthirius multifiliis]EGR31826.1 hypothetical protein IMG5_101400 [Ichthyophthirius multifiliis]|eukprot:XP_004035312.1 hypothetical protein IMG5_101400 [Ichthyophthirius multifiliis]
MKASQILIIFLILSINSLIANSKIKSHNPSHFLTKYNKKIQQKQSESQDKCYGIVFDCGSSGTRYYVYQWECRSESSLPQLDFSQILSEKVNNPIAKHYTNPQALDSIFNPFFNKIKSIIPEDKHSSTLLMLGATAGMRLITKMQQFVIIDRIRTLFRNSGFLFLGDDRSRVINGEEEAVFLWVAVNYMLKNISLESDVDNPETVTTIDIGGASTQIAFSDIIDNQEAEEFYTLQVPQLPEQKFNFTLKGASELLGMDVSRYEILQSEVKADNISYASCFNQGFENNDTRLGKIVKGQGNPENCINKIRNLFQISNCSYPDEKNCSAKSIFIKGPQGKTTYAVSAALYAKLAYFGDVPEFNPHDLRNAAIEFCKQKHQDVVAKEPKNKFIDIKCYQGLYASTLLIDGYGVGDMQIQSPSEIQTQEPTWALGLLLFELSKRNSDSR